MIKVEYRKGSPRLFYKEKRDKQKKEMKQMLSIMFPEGIPREPRSKQSLINQSSYIKRRYHERYK